MNYLCRPKRPNFIANPCMPNPSSLSLYKPYFKVMSKDQKLDVGDMTNKGA